MPPSYSDRVQAIPGWLRGLIVGPCVLLGVVLGAYWWWSYSGLYQWLAEGQIYLMGSYFPVYTGIFNLVLTAFVCAVPAILILYLLVKLEVYPPDGTPALVDASKLRGEAVDRWLKRHIWLLIFLGIGLTGLIVGSVLYLSGATAGARTDLRLEDLEAGATPASRWVRVRGKLLWDAAVTFGQRGPPDTYVPMVSPQWRPGQPVSLYVRVYEHQKADATAPELEGMLALGGLPGVVRTRFEQHGPAPMARYELLALGDQPQRSVEIGWQMMLCSIALLALTGLIWAVLFIRAQSVLRPPAAPTNWLASHPNSMRTP